MNRPDLAALTVGAMYRHNGTHELVEYLGTAFVPELQGEDVAVFRFVDRGGCLVATSHDYDLWSQAMGDREFTPFGDAVEEERHGPQPRSG